VKRRAETDKNNGSTASSNALKIDDSQSPIGYDSFIHAFHPSAAVLFHTIGPVSYRREHVQLLKRIHNSLFPKADATEI
jgi:hypothetical protein